MNDLDLILNCDTKKHEYLFVQKGQLIKRKVSFCGRIVMWFNSRLNSRSAAFTKVIDYVEKNVSFVVNDNQEKKLENFIKRINKFGSNHLKNLHSIDNIIRKCFKFLSKEFQANTLFNFAYYGDTELFKELWGKKSFSDDFKYKNYSFIHYSIFLGHKKLLEFLLENKSKFIVEDGLTLSEQAKRYNKIKFKSSYSFLKKIDYSEVIEYLEKREGNFTRDNINFRIFNDTFGLKNGGFAVQDLPFLHTSLIESLNQARNLSEFINQNYQEIVQALETTFNNNVDEIYKQSLKKFALISCGWNSHSVAVVFTKELCIKIDGNKGVLFYSINKPRNLKKAIKKILHNHTNNISFHEGHYFFHNKLNEILDLKYYEKCKILQDSPNCLLFSLLLGLQIIFTQIKSEKTNYRKEFRIWQSVDRIMNLKRIDPILRRYPDLFDLKKIYLEAIERCKKDKMPEVIDEIYKLEPSLKNE